MALQVSPVFKQIVIPKYVDPKTLDPATQPKLSQGKVTTGDKVEKFLEPVRKVFEGTPIGRKPVKETVKEDSLVNTYEALTLKKMSGQTLTSEETDLKNQGEKISYQRNQDLVMGFVGGGSSMGKDAVKKSSKEVSSYLKSKVAVKAPIKQKLPEAVYNGWNKFYSSFVDRFKPITEIKNLSPKNLKSGENPEILARRFLGVKGVAESKLFWKTTSLDKAGDITITGGGLSDAIGSFKNNVDDLKSYLIAKRDLRSEE